MESKEHILSIAFKLFFQKGYKEVTMSDLVKESGLSKGAFYHYFSSKEELYNHSMEMFINNFLDGFELQYDETMTLRNNLKSLYKRFSPLQDHMNSATQESADVLSNYMIFLQSLMRKPEFRQKLHDYNTNFYKQFDVWIKNAQSRGEIVSQLDSMLMARHLAALMKGIGTLYAFVDQEEPPTVTFGRIIDQLFDLIETHPNNDNLI